MSITGLTIELQYKQKVMSSVGFYLRLRQPEQ